jgi:hypothetical protein
MTYALSLSFFEAMVLNALWGRGRLLADRAVTPEGNGRRLARHLQPSSRRGHWWLRVVLSVGTSWKQASMSPVYYQGVHLPEADAQEHHVLLWVGLSASVAPLR